MPWTPTAEFSQQINSSEKQKIRKDLAVQKLFDTQKAILLGLEPPLGPLLPNPIDIPEKLREQTSEFKKNLNQSRLLNSYLTEISFYDRDGLPFPDFEVEKVLDLLPFFREQIKNPDSPGVTLSLLNDCFKLHKKNFLKEKIFSSEETMEDVFLLLEKHFRTDSIYLSLCSQTCQEIVRTFISEPQFRDRALLLLKKVAKDAVINLDYAKQFGPALELILRFEPRDKHPQIQERVEEIVKHHKIPFKFQQRTEDESHVARIALEANRVIIQHLDNLGVDGAKIYNAWRRSCDENNSAHAVSVNLAQVNRLEGISKGAVQKLWENNNIACFARYSLEMLLEQLEPIGKRRRGVAVTIMRDHNGAFFNISREGNLPRVFEMAKEHYKIDLFEIHQNEDFAKFLGHKEEMYDFEVFSAHGNKTGFQTGDLTHPDINLQDILGAPHHFGFGSVRKGGFVISSSCSTAYLASETETEKGLAQGISTELGLTVVGPEIDAGLKGLIPRFSPDGEIVDFEAEFVYCNSFYDQKSKSIIYAGTLAPKHRYQSGQVVY
jgi:hypothetical protein